MTKEQWKKKALAWKLKFQGMRNLKNIWKSKYLIMRDLGNEWRDLYWNCEEKLKACDPDPQPSKAIKSLSIKDGKFIVNGKQTELIGVSKREMVAVGSGDKPQSEVNYTYAQIRQSILASKINYIRVIAPKNLVFFRQEIIDYLEAGKVPEVELFDSGNPYRAYQANWKDTFNAVKDLPVFFDAHNEFVDNDYVTTVHIIVTYIIDHGGLVCAGAWGSSNYGEKYAKNFKFGNNKYQIVSHHRQWTQSSINSDREPGKPLIWNEIHTRDHGLAAIKSKLKLGYEICEGVQIYSLQNFGMGQGSNFQKILDYAGSLVK